MVEHTPVKSSNIASVGYNHDEQILHVRFNNGSEYTYHDVPPDEYEDLLAAPSVGSHLNDNIKGIYRHRRV